MTEITDKIKQWIQNNKFKKIDLVYYGDTLSARRPKSTIIAGNVSVYDDPRDKSYKMEFLEQVQQQLGKDFSIIEGEIHMTISSYRPILKSLNKFKKILAEMKLLRPTTKPDTDNIAKLVMDAMNKKLYLDDSQISDLRVKKYFGLKPRVEVKIRYREKATY